jgi:hypothetical protein|tara:strand:+ start:1333 stop:1449 length:117 start_codon:yes stop_codon:yes gene_type:complete
VFLLVNAPVQWQENLSKKKRQLSMRVGVYSNAIKQVIS